ncbi:HAMP domain-containing sensor histidine kinase [Pontibacter sp. 13R65]|uniref:sensor histidine kinase n=1 Tax=Pontibacter sp. 13R65 TaxID=3127458 RepID=UPI00301C0838
MTMYLLGVIGASVFFVFSLKEVLVLMVLVSMTFTVGLSLCSLSLEQEVLNSFGSMFILTCFFFISRIIYSYRLNHHVQVKLIKAQRRQIQKNSLAKSEILRIVAHDMRAPFANIEMLVTLLRKRKNMQPEQQEQYYEMILKSCHKSKGLINDLLELANLEQNKELPLEPIDLNLFMFEVQEEWQHKLGENKRLVFNFPEKPVFVGLHKQKFQRVLENLLSNAVKFTPENGIIQVAMQESGNGVTIQIADNGIGVPLHLQQHLFKPFSKAGRKGLKGETSVGLGLNISQKLVEQHGGTISVESEEEKGTTFHIKLPLASKS